MSANPRLLVVDDEPAVLSGLAHQLRRDFEVSCAGSGAEAVRLLESSAPFDVVMSDMNMSGMDGVAVLSAARRLSPDSARVLLTGQATLESALRAVNEGHVWRIVLKPVNGEAMRALLVEAVEMARTKSAERRQMAARLEAIEAQLARSTQLATAGSLVGSVGHELNNITTAFHCLLSMLKSSAAEGQPPDAGDLDDLTRIEAHLAEHGRQLLRLVRPSPALRQRVDLSQVLRSSGSLLRSTGIVKHLTFGLHEPEKPIWVEGNAVQLEQVLVNLVKNASDALQATRDARRIDVRVAEAPDSVTLEVEDNGSGIPAEALPHIFESFFTTKGPEKGTGLGLPLVKRVIEEMGGTVGVTSETPGGTRVRLCIPRLPDVETGPSLNVGSG